MAEENLDQRILVAKAQIFDLNNMIESVTIKRNETLNQLGKLLQSKQNEEVQKEAPVAEEPKKEEEA